MARKKRFQQEDWKGQSLTGRQKRERRAFALTIAVAVLVAAAAWGMLRSTTTLHAPFAGSTTTAP